MEAREVAQAGGKGAKLGALMRAGFEAPGGFVVMTEGFEKTEAMGAIVGAYRQLGDEVAVAVRSSATLEDLDGGSMAGQFATFLNVRGEAAVTEAVRKCWASARSERVEAYLREKGIAGELKMAVVVQRMVEAEVAGVLFTENPGGGGGKGETRNAKHETGNGNDETTGGRMIIEASWGLGEAVVSGMVEPDHLEVEKGAGRIVSQRMGTKLRQVTAKGEEDVAAEMRGKLCLGAGDVQMLWELGKKAEAEFGAGQDVEWAIAGEGGVRKLYCLQVRAITTLAGSDDGGVVERVRSWLKERREKGRGPWARHNLGETARWPTPLTWSLLKRFMSGAGGFGEMHREAGFVPSAAVMEEGFLELIGGRIYMDVSRAGDMFCEQFPLAYDVARLRRNPAEAQGRPTVSVGGVRARWQGNRVIAAAGARIQHLTQTLDRRLLTEEFPTFGRWVEQERACDLTGVSAEDWVKLWQQRVERVFGASGIAGRALLPGMVLGQAMENLRLVIAEHCWDEDAAADANVLATLGEMDATLRMNDGLWRVGRGEMTLKEWMEKFGFRGVDELDLASPRWAEMPADAAALAQDMARGERPSDVHQRQQAVAQALVRRLESLMPAAAFVELTRRLDIVRRYARFREDGKHEWVRGVGLLRAMAGDGARRLKLDMQDVVLLTDEEFVSAVRAGNAETFAEVIAQRKRVRLAERRVMLPDVIDREEIEQLEKSVAIPTVGERMNGFGLSGGTGKGRVMIAATPEEGRRKARGMEKFVLVCESTDPSWTPLFVNAAAIVLERGGALSHGAVVAREMGKPAVVVSGATRVLVDGAEVVVDGDAGCVFVGEARGTGEADLNDERIAPGMVPPAEGQRERTGGRISNWLFLVWGVYLLAAYLLPAGNGLWGASVEVMDAVFWPLIRAAGRFWGVVILAAVMAMLTMLAQWAWTDVVRLREVKRRARALAKEAKRLAVGHEEATPREAAMSMAAARAEWRVARAGFVPLGILLGPMVVAFMWLPERVDMASANPAPGSRLVIAAAVEEGAAPVTLKVDGGATLDEGAGAATQEVPSIRGTLEQMERELSAAANGGTLSPAVAARLSSTGKTPVQLLAELRAFLSKPLPEQVVNWTVLTPADAQVMTVAIDEAVKQKVATGDVLPPPLDVKVQNTLREKVYVVDAAMARGGVKSITIRWTDERKPDEKAFWRPLKWLGIGWDAGWLWIYMVIYLPVMVLMRRVLRLP